jgi:hypothetical protein
MMGRTLRIAINHLVVKDLRHPSQMPADYGKGLLGDLTLVKLVASSPCSNDAGRASKAMVSDEASRR